MFHHCCQLSAFLLSTWLGDLDLLTFLLQASVFSSVKQEQIPIPPPLQGWEERKTSAQCMHTVGVHHMGVSFYYPEFSQPISKPRAAAGSKELFSLRFCRADPHFSLAIRAHSCSTLSPVPTGLNQRCPCLPGIGGLERAFLTCPPLLLLSIMGFVEWTEAFPSLVWPSRQPSGPCAEEEQIRKVQNSPRPQGSHPAGPSPFNDSN